MPTPKTANLLFFSHDSNLAPHLKKFFHSQPFHLTFIDNLQSFQSSSPPHYLIVALTPSLSSSQIDTLITHSHHLAQESSAKIAFLVIDDFFQPFPSDKLSLVRQKLSHLTPSLHRLILTQNIYSNLDSSSTSSFEKNLFKISQKQKITITKQGSTPLYPTSLSDLLQGTLKSLFLQHTTNQEFVLLGEETNDLSFAYLIKKNLEANNLNLDIDALLPSPDPLTNWQTSSSRSQAKLNWKPQQNFDLFLKKKIPLFLSSSSQKSKLSSPNFSPPPSISNKSFSPSPLAKNTPFLNKFSFKKINTLLKKRPSSSSPHKPLKRRLLSRGLRYLFFSLLFLILLPTLIWFFTLFRSISLTRSSFSTLRQGQLNPSTQKLISAQRNFRFTQSFTPYFTLPFKLFSPTLSRQITNFVNLLGQLQSTLYSSQQNYLLAEKIYQQTLQVPSSSSSPSSSTYNLSLAFESQVGLLHHQIDQLHLSLQNQSLPFSLDEKIINSLKPLSIDKLRTQISRSLTYSQLLSQLLHQPLPQNFVLILQNPYQLRPSGGSIVSAVAFTLEQQQLKNFRHFSLSDLASKQTGQIDQPELLDQITGQTTSFDALNYHPDFTSTAQITSSFFTNFLGFKPNAIFYLDALTLESLLVSNQEDSSSLQSLLLQSDLNQTSVFFKQLTQQLTQQFQSNQIPFSSFSRLFLDSPSGSSFQAYFSDPNLENLIINQPLAGNINFPSCHPLLSSTSCIPDLFYFSEANLTFSPLNFYQSRQISHQVDFSPEGIKHQIDIQYLYSPSTPDLNRPYLPVYQFFLSPSSSFLTAKLDDKIVDLQPLVSTTSANLTHFEISLPHSTPETHHVQFSFLRPWSVGESFSNPFTYSLTLLRQPSTFNHPYQLSLTTPSQSQLSAITAPITSTPTGLLFSLPQSSPYNFAVQYQSP